MKDPEAPTISLFLSDSDSSKTAVQSDISAYSRKFSVKNYSNLLQNSKSNQNDSFHEQKLKQICKETKIKSFHRKTFT